ncbi:MAG: MBL fold metallo-hydrolase [Desulfobacterales bacterium]|nr:MBL fold metallo-hydrolase [Desulfobacterales bacterium]
MRGIRRVGLTTHRFGADIRYAIAVETAFARSPSPRRSDGFADFISAWLVQGRPSFLVDVGPASTAGQLLAALDTLGVTRLDYILLTHIHLDHAGAIGQVARRFPAARIVCHEKGIPHLVDPTQLWEGTRKVLGAGGRRLRSARACAGRSASSPAQGFAADGIAAADHARPRPASCQLCHPDMPVCRRGLRRAVPLRRQAANTCGRPPRPRFFMNAALGEHRRAHRARAGAHGGGPLRHDRRWARPAAPVTASSWCSGRNGSTDRIGGARPGMRRFSAAWRGCWPRTRCCRRFDQFPAAGAEAGDDIS